MGHVTHDISCSRFLLLSPWFPNLFFSVNSLTHRFFSLKPLTPVPYPDTLIFIFWPLTAIIMIMIINNDNNHDEHLLNHHYMSNFFFSILFIFHLALKQCFELSILDIPALQIRKRVHSWNNPNKVMCFIPWLINEN